MKKTALLPLLLAAGAIHAANTQDAALSCRLMEDSIVRLACFDKIYGRQLPPSKPIAPPEGDQASKTVDLENSYRSSIESKSPQVVFSEANLPEHTADAYSDLSLLYDLDKNDENGLLSVREHNPMYLIPLWYRSSPNYYPQTPTRGVTVNDVHSEQKHLETKMQVSFKTKLLQDLFKTRADVWFGYTQQSNWQVYNQGKKSAPFRNSDYQPEIFITQPVKAALPFGGKLRMVGAGYVHQSNGQSRPLSRSWNRIYLMAGAEWGKFTVVPRVWARIDPSRKEKDDNPDIGKYMGYGDLRTSYRINEKHTLSTLTRFNFGSGKGAMEVSYTFPIKGKLKAYLQGFYGYGESLIDYNHKQKGIGLGVMFRDWDGL